MLGQLSTCTAVVRRGLGLRLLAALAGAAIGLVLTEVCLRLMAPVGFHVWMPNRRMVFEPLHGAMPGVTGTARFVVSPEGVRGRPVADSDGHRILVLGGSTAECLYLDQQEAWPAIVESSLRRALGRSDLWVGNAARSGHSTRDHRLQVPRLLDQLAPVDTVVLLVGINDLILRMQRDVDYQPLIAEPPEYHSELERHAFAIRRAWRLTSPGGSRSSPWFKRTELWLMLRRTWIRFGATAGREVDGRQNHAGEHYVRDRKRRQQALAFRPEPPDLGSGLREFTDNLRFIVDAARQRGAHVVLMTQPSMYRPDLPPAFQKLLWLGWVGDNRQPGGNEYYSVEALAKALDRYNARLLDVCAAARTGCIDLAAALPRDTTAFYDDVHFNEEGARQVAAQVTPHLLDRLLTETESGNSR